MRSEVAVSVAKPLSALSGVSAAIWAVFKGASGIHLNASDLESKNQGTIIRVQYEVDQWHKGWDLIAQDLVYRAIEKR